MRRLSVSVATGRVAVVFLEDRQLIGWCRSAQAFAHPTKTNKIVSGWITGFGPDQVIVEDRASAQRKGPQSRKITELVATSFAQAACLDVRVPRSNLYPNKYEEAAALAEAFPEARSILPQQPPIWLPEPRNMSYFEALALASSVMN